MGSLKPGRHQESGEMNIKSRSNWKLLLALGAAILALIVVGAISYRAVVVSSESELLVGHTHDVIENLQTLVITMEDMESDGRGFALTGQDSYLQSFHSSEPIVDQELATLRTLTADNPVQQSNLTTLSALATQRIQHLNVVISLRQTQGLAAASAEVQTGVGQKTMGDLLAVTNEMKAEELRLLALRDADSAGLLAQSKIVVLLGTIVGLLIVAIAGWSIKKDITAQTGAESHRVQMEDRYRGLLEAAPDAMVVVNQGGEIVLLNVQAEKKFGYSRDELLGQKVKNIIPKGFAERLIADEIRSPADALAQQIGTGIELSGLRKDGSEFPIEIMLSPLESTDGILVTAAIRDISVRKAAENYLVQMEGRYRGLLEAAPDAMVVVNQGGEIVLLNVQAEKKFGYSRDELLGQQVKNIIPEGFAERLIADETRSPADALAQQIGTGIELLGLRKDGSEFPIEIMLSPLESTDGILVTAAIRYISVRKAAENHLVQMEGRYRGLLEAAPDAMVVVNQVGEIVILNMRAEKEFGYSRNELLGQKVKNIIPEGFAERLIADETRSAPDALAQQIGTGIELSGLRKDGSEFPIEIMLSPLENTDGILVTAAIRDISVRKAAENHLVQMEGRYRGLLEAAPDAMVVVNPEGEIVLLNVQSEKKFGYSRD